METGEEEEEEEERNKHLGGILLWHFPRSRFTAGTVIITWSSSGWECENTLLCICMHVSVYLVLKGETASATVSA